MKTIKSIKGNGDFTNDHGTFYSFEYEFTDNTIFLANHKSQQSPYKLGDEVEINQKGATKDGTPYGGISKPKPVFNGYQGKKQTNSTASFSLAYAKDVAVAHISQGKDFKASQIIQVATEFNNWLKQNS